MSIPRRGYIAAGLAAAVVGSLGVISTLQAGADEVTEPPAAVAGTAVAAPPARLPWGEEPEPVKTGARGADSESLADSGADIAAAGDVASTKPDAEFGPKGFTSKRRELSQSTTTVAPQPPLVQTLAEPVPGALREVYYHYSSAYQYTESPGTYANLVIGRPSLHQDDYHTLAEIAVQSADGRQIVEVGWTVDRGVNGDEDPHLFVYHWVDGQSTCYNACGFVQYSNSAVPGSTLPYNTAKRFGIQYYNGAWWIAYDTEWVGYFPVRLWNTEFTKSGLIQWFGEVAASSTRPCTDMGTGADAYDYAAARFGTIALLNGQEPSLSLRSTSPYNDGGIYPITKLSERTVRYGGPGAC